MLDAEVGPKLLLSYRLWVTAREAVRDGVWGRGESAGVCLCLQPGSLPCASGSVKLAFILSVASSKAACSYRQNNRRITGVTRSWPNALRHIFFWGSGRKRQAFPISLQCERAWLDLCGSEQRSSSRFPGKLAALSCPLKPDGKIGQKGFSWGCTDPSNAQAMPELSWRKVPTVLEKGMDKQSN